MGTIPKTADQVLIQSVFDIVVVVVVVIWKKLFYKKYF
jgi:hypothetical protein